MLMIVYFCNQLMYGNMKRGSTYFTAISLNQLKNPHDRNKKQREASCPWIATWVLKYNRGYHFFSSASVPLLCHCALTRTYLKTRS